MVRFTQKRKRGGGPDPAAAGAGAPAPVAAPGAAAPSALDGDEATAFPHDEDRVRAVSDRVKLMTIPLNTDFILPGDQEKFADIVQKVDYIHCRAFDRKSGILVLPESPKLSFIDTKDIYGKPYLKSYLCILSQAVPTNTSLDIILVCIVHIISDSGAEQEIRIDSVAKNPHILFPNAFKKCLLALKEAFPSAIYYNLLVYPYDTMTITEQGRLRLNASLGFRLNPGQWIELIYPKVRAQVIRHQTTSRGTVLLNLDGKVICSHIGNIKSVSDAEGHNHPLYMEITKEDIGKTFNIYIGARDKLKGTSAYFLDYLEGTGSVFIEEPNELTDNQSIPIDLDMSSIFIRGFYHMGIEDQTDERYPANGFLENFTVPDDFVIFTVTSPGSYLYSHSHEIIRFTNGILEQLEKGRVEEFIENNKSTQKHPIPYLGREKDYIKIITTGIPENDDNLCQLQQILTLKASKLMEQLGRQPIFQFPLGPESGPNKQYQLDFQLYGPGMKIFNFHMSRSSTDRMNTEHLKLGTYVDFGRKLESDVDFTNKDGTLKDYLEYIRNEPSIERTSSKPKYLLFLFGCAANEHPRNSDERNYELLYELSHRRFHIDLPRGISFSHPDFIERFIFNKKKTLEYDCSAHGSENTLKIRGGGQSKRKKLRKTRKSRLK